MDDLALAALRLPDSPQAPIIGDLRGGAWAADGPAITNGEPGARLRGEGQAAGRDPMALARPVSREVPRRWSLARLPAGCTSVQFLVRRCRLMEGGIG
jgi:hypothetical protein